MSGSFAQQNKRGKPLIMMIYRIIKYVLCTTMWQYLRVYSDKSLYNK